MNHNERPGKDRSFPPNYASFVLFFNLMTKAFLIILGIGKCFLVSTVSSYAIASFNE